MSVGENIKKYRKEKGLTQKQLAGNTELDISVRTLQKYESGEIKPPLDKINALSSALEVPVTELIENKKIGLQEIIEDAFRYGKSKNIEEISEKTRIPLDKIISFLSGADPTIEEYDKIVNSTFGSYRNYINECPRKVAERLADERAKHDNALNGLYTALQYHYGHKISKNLQREIFISLDTNGKKIFYTKEEFEKILEFVATSFPNFKTIMNNDKNINSNDNK